MKKKIDFFITALRTIDSSEHFHENFQTWNIFETEQRPIRMLIIYSFTIHSKMKRNGNFRMLYNFTISLIELENVPLNKLLLFNWVISHCLFLLQWIVKMANVYNVPIIIIMFISKFLLKWMKKGRTFK